MAAISVGETLTMLISEYHIRVKHLYYTENTKVQCVN